jgi:DNA-directed RNA polymerase subunit RPC12/RpoP
MDTDALCMDCGTTWIVQERADLSEYDCLRCGGSLEPIAAPVAEGDHALSALP